MPASGCEVAARAAPVRQLSGPAWAKSGGTPRLFPLAIMWPPCSAAIPLNDSGYWYAMPKVQTALQIPVQIAHRAFTAGHSRHYAAEEPHPPEVLDQTERVPGTCLSRELLSALAGSQQSYGGSVSMRASPARKCPSASAGRAPS